MNKIKIFGCLLLLSTFVLGFIWADGSGDPFRYLVLTIVAMNGAIFVIARDDALVSDKIRTSKPLRKDGKK